MKQDREKPNHYYSATFWDDVKTAGLSEQTVRRRSTRITNNPNCGKSIDVKAPECREFPIIISGNVYYWHYIWLEEDDEIQSVALKRYRLDDLGMGPIDKFLFGAKLCGVMAREFLKGLLLGG